MVLEVFKESKFASNQFLIIKIFIRIWLDILVKDYDYNIISDGLIYKFHLIGKSIVF